MPNPDNFTGERFLPECAGEIWAEHWHRYLFAALHVSGKDVLDVACGEGYGAAWLARHAKSVTGLDLDAPTIAAARSKYRAPGLRFKVGSVAAMPFPDHSFDCAVSFETLEHLAEQRAMLADLRRVLRPDGILIISTPNKVEYSEKRDFHNEFHVHELYEEEFHALLAGYFDAQRWYGQRLVFNSALWPLPPASADGSDVEWIALEPSDRKMPPPMYFVALAAASESLLPRATAMTLLADPSDAMYREYALTVARAAKLEQLVDERDRQLLSHDRHSHHVETLIAERDSQLSALAARAGAMEKLIAERERLIVERDDQIEAVNRLVAESERLITERDRQLASHGARIGAAEALIVERDGQLAVANDRSATLERLLVEREGIIVERDGQLAATNARLATAEVLIAERDGQLAATNARLATAEVLIAERERLIVERDGQLAATNTRLATAEVLIAERERIIVERDGQLAELVRHIAALEQDLMQRNQRLLDQDQQIDALANEVARRAGWRWWLALPFLRIRRMVSSMVNALRQGGP